MSEEQNLDEMLVKFTNGEQIQLDNVTRVTQDGEFIVARIAGDKSVSLYSKAILYMARHPMNPEGVDS